MLQFTFKFNVLLVYLNYCIYFICEVLNVEREESLIMIVIFHNMGHYDILVCSIL